MLNRIRWYGISHTFGRQVVSDACASKQHIDATVITDNAVYCFFHGKIIAYILTIHS